MLRVMREGAVSKVFKYVILGLLMAGAAGLALSDHYGLIGSRAGSSAVATVGSTKIEGVSFDQTVRRALAQQGLDAGTAYQMGYINQMLDSQVNGMLVSRAAGGLGLRVDDDMVTKRIRELIEPMTAGGMKPSEALQAVLRSQNMSEAQLMDAVRNDMTGSMILESLSAGTNVASDTETLDLALFRGEKRKIEFAFLPDSGIKDYKTPADEVLKPFYQSGQERYAVPESRGVTLAILSGASLKEGVTVTDDELKKVYEEQKDSFALPERRALDQAILPDEKQAKAVLDAAVTEKSLKDAVKKVTGDTKMFTGNQTYQRDGLDKAIADVAFKTETGKTGGPVHTPLGWHVFTVTEIKPAEQQSFDAVKETLRKDMSADRQGEALFNASTQVEDQLAGGAPLEDTAKSYGMEIVTLGPVHKDGSTPDKKDGMKDFAKESAAILNAAFGQDEGESALIPLSDGRYAAVRTDKIVPKSYMPFDQVKDDLAKLWIADQQSVLNRQRGEAALAKLKEGKETLEQLAKETGAAVKTIETDRVAPAQEPLNDQAKAVFFGAEKNTWLMPPAKGGFLIGRVTSVTLPDPARIPADQLKSLREALTPALQNEIAEAYLDTLRKQYKVTVNQEALEKMYGAESTADEAP